jgi:hypothetical protein
MAWSSFSFISYYKETKRKSVLTDVLGMVCFDVIKGSIRMVNVTGWVSCDYPDIIRCLVISGIRMAGLQFPKAKKKNQRSLPAKGR